MFSEVASADKISKTSLLPPHHSNPRPICAYRCKIYRAPPSPGGIELNSIYRHMKKDALNWRAILLEPPLKPHK